MPAGKAEVVGIGAEGAAAPEAGAGAFVGGGAGAGAGAEVGAVGVVGIFEISHGCEFVGAGAGAGGAGVGNGVDVAAGAGGSVGAGGGAGSLIFSAERGKVAFSPKLSTTVTWSPVVESTRKTSSLVTGRFTWLVPRMKSTVPGVRSVAVSVPDAGVRVASRKRKRSVRNAGAGMISLLYHTWLDGLHPFPAIAKFGTLDSVWWPRCR